PRASRGRAGRRARARQVRHGVVDACRASARRVRLQRRVRGARLMTPSTFSREYPDAPRAGVGAVVLDGDRVLLVRRGQPPSLGKWSIPGGLIHLGERIEDAVIREVEEECGLTVKIVELCGVIDRVTMSETPSAVRYHYVIIDYVAVPASGTVRA